MPDPHPRLPGVADRAQKRRLRGLQALLEPRRAPLGPALLYLRRREKERGVGRRPVPLRFLGAVLRGADHAVVHQGRPEMLAHTLAQIRAAGVIEVERGCGGRQAGQLVVADDAVVAAKRAQKVLVARRSQADARDARVGAQAVRGAIGRLARRAGDDHLPRAEKRLIG